MASSPVSDDAAASPIAVSASAGSPVTATIQSQAGQTAIPVHEVPSSSCGTKRRRRRPAAAAVPVVHAAADADALAQLLQQARNQMAEVLAAIVALRAEVASFRNHVDAYHAEVLAAIASINLLCRLLRFLGGSGQ